MKRNAFRRRLTGLSLRRRLTIAITLTTGLAVLAVLLFARARTDQITSFLSEQLQTTIQQQAEQQLRGVVRQQSESADRFFRDVASAVDAAGSYMDALLSRESLLTQGDYWDAHQELLRLPGGNWDNSNTDPGSVYARSSLDLTETTYRELNAGIYLDFLVPSMLRANSSLVAMYFVDSDGVTIYYPNIDLATLVGDYNPSTSGYFTAAAPDQNPEREPIWSTPYQDNALTGLIVTSSTPVYDQSGRFRGVVAADVQLATITDQVSRVQVGESGYAFLIDSQGRIIAMPDAGYRDFGLEHEQVPVGESPTQSVLGHGPQALQDVAARMVAGESGLARASIGGIDRFVSYAPLSDVGYGLAVVVSVDELTGPLMAANDRIAAETRTTLSLVVLIFVAVVLAAFVISWGLGRVMAAPLTRLTQTAQRITAGDLDVQAPLDVPGEIGVLSRAFNAMTANVHELVNSLEARVEARTEQLQASADVGRAAASILDPDQLLRQVANLIGDRFGFYYVAVFTLDEKGKYAVLREATGEAGQVLKARGHQLEVGGASMVGSAIATRKPRIALDVGEEPMRFANPLLPNTRSEIALPLMVGERAFGALDVQSTQEAAFDETRAAVLQAMADQIAIALNNANSYAETQSAEQRSSALYTASRHLGQIEGDLNTIVGAMLEAVGHLVGFSQWWVVQLDDGREHLLPMASSLSRGPHRNVRVADQVDSPVVRSALHGEIHLINDPVGDPRMRAIPAERRAGIGKFLSVPIISREMTVGAVSLGRSVDGRDLDDNDAELGKSLASLIAIAIENRRLLEQTRRALDEVDAINRRLTGEVWSDFSRRLSREGVRWVGSHGSAEQSSPEVAEALALGEIVTRPAADTDMLNVAVPIALRGLTIGALQLAVPGHAWSSELALALDAIAGHVAQAAENARLVEMAEDRARRERALTEATDKIRRKADMERILQTAAEELARYLRAGRVAVRLGLPAGGAPDDGDEQVE